MTIYLCNGNTKGANMEYDETKLYDGTNADKLKNNTRGIFADEYWELVEAVENARTDYDKEFFRPVQVLDEKHNRYLNTENGVRYPFFYAVIEE